MSESLKLPISIKPAWFVKMLRNSSSFCLQLWHSVCVKTQATSTVVSKAKLFSKDGKMLSKHWWLTLQLCSKWGLGFFFAYCVFLGDNTALHWSSHNTTNITITAPFPPLSSVTKKNLKCSDLGLFTQIHPSLLEEGWSKLLSSKISFWVITPRPKTAPVDSSGQLSFKLFPCRLLSTN